MTTRPNTLASPKTRDLLASLDVRVRGEEANEAEIRPEDLGPDAPDSPDALNDAEADNLSFIVSDKFSRLDLCMTSLESETPEVNYAELSKRVAERLEALSRRLLTDADAAGESR